MSLKKIFGAAATAFALVTGAASAETISFQFQGKVTYGSPMAILIGTPVTGTFSYDTSTLPSGTDKGYASYQIPSPHLLSAVIGGHNISAQNLQVSIWNHYKGNVEDMVNISGGPAILDGTSFTNGSFGFVLSSGPRSNNAINSTDLPKSFDIRKFNADPSLTYGYLQSDGGPTGQLLQFSVDSIMVLRTSQ